MLSRTPAVIVDLDGSLVDMSPAVHLVRGRKRDLDAFHAFGVEEALPNPSILERVRAHQAARRRILYVTGRKRKWMDGTQAWMERHEVPVGLLFMRADADHRPDNVVKQEIWERHIAPHYDIVEAIEDRPRVVQMWQDLGFHVHVVPGWEE